jgi:hypothetical protein
MRPASSIADAQAGPNHMPSDESSAMPRREASVAAPWQPSAANRPAASGSCRRPLLPAGAPPRAGGVGGAAIGVAGGRSGVGSDRRRGRNWVAVRPPARSQRPDHRPLSCGDGGAPRGIRTPTARSVAWCSTSSWSAPDGSGLLRLDASTIWSDPSRVPSDRLDDQPDDQGARPEPSATLIAATIREPGPPLPLVAAVD